MTTLLSCDKYGESLMLGDIVTHENGKHKYKIIGMIYENDEITYEVKRLDNNKMYYRQEHQIVFYDNDKNTDPTPKIVQEDGNYVYHGLSDGSNAQS